MSEAYEVTFLNDSDTSYHFALYQHFPESPGLNSVAWKVRGIPPKGVIPSSAVVNWTMNYGVSIANWNPNGAVYTGSQVVAAELGKEYQVILTDGDIPAIQSDPIGDTHPGYITLVNDTNIALEMGVTIDGTFVAVQTVNGGERMNFGTVPTFYTACFRSIKVGQSVSSGIALSPVQIRFENGYTKCVVTTELNKGKKEIRDPQYVH